MIKAEYCLTDDNRATLDGKCCVVYQASILGA